MSRIDAALRRARLLSGPAAEWQDFTPAAEPSPRDLDGLPSETGVQPRAAEPGRARIWPSPDPPRTMVPVHRPVAVPVMPAPPPPEPIEVIAAPDHQAGPPVGDEGFGSAAAVPEPEEIADGFDASVDVLPDAAADSLDAEAMFQALDRVLKQTPLTSRRRAARPGAGDGLPGAGNRDA